MKFTTLLIATALLSLPAAASPETEALWAKIATVPDLKGVDQIVIEGDNGGVLMGVLQKRNWLYADPVFFEKRFFTKLERVCDYDTPKCFRVPGIWSNGSKIPGSD